MTFGNTTRMLMAAGALAAAMAPALAQGRPDARAMSCDEVRAMIAAHGAVVLTTGRHTYDRYVRHRGYCASPEIARMTTIRTRDAAECPVHACRPNPFDD